MAEIEDADDNIRRATVVLSAVIYDKKPSILVEIIGMRNLGGEAPALADSLHKIKNITVLRDPDSILKHYCQISELGDIDALVERIRNFPLPQGEGGFDKTNIGNRVQGADRRSIDINRLKEEFASLATGQNPDRSTGARLG